MAETIAKFFEQSDTARPTKTSDLTVYDIDKFLDEMTKLTKEEEQQYKLKMMTKQCTVNDLKMIIWLMKVLRFIFTRK